MPEANEENADFQMKKVSIIIPIKAKDFIEECAISIFSQTYENIEYIFVNDCTPDNSVEILNETLNLFPKRQNQVKIITQKHNQGQAAARNKALDVFSGDFVAFVDSDDYLTDKNIIADAISILDRDPSISFVQFPYFKDGKAFNKKDLLVDNTPEMYQLWVNGKIITNYFCDKIFSRNVIESLRFKEGIIFEDRHLFPSILNNCSKVALCSKIGAYFYRTHAGQTTQRNDSHAFQCQIIADMRILQLIPQQLTKEALIVYWRAISNSIASHNHETIQPYSRSIAEIICADIPIGIKLRLSLIKLIGLKNYLKIAD
ncbi:MAG: glycosyltransferase family 2 protein [Muribaculaceae bacterium]